MTPGNISSMNSPASAQAGQTANLYAQSSAQAQAATQATDAKQAAQDTVRISSEASTRSGGELSGSGRDARVADQYLSGMQDVIGSMQKQVASLQDAVSGAAGTDSTAAQQDDAGSSSVTASQTSADPVTAAESQNLTQLATADALVNGEAQAAAATDGNLPPAFEAAANVAALREEQAAKSSDNTAGADQESQTLAQLGTASAMLGDAAATAAADDGDVSPAFAVATDASALQEEGSDSSGTSADLVTAGESQNLAQLGTAQQEVTDAQAQTAASDGNLGGGYAVASDVVALREEKAAGSADKVGQSQATVDQQLQSLADAGASVGRQQQALAAAGVEMPEGFSVSLDLSTLGAVQTEDGSTVSLADIGTGGAADAQTNPDLAAAVLQQAQTDLSAAGTQVENYRSVAAKTTEEDVTKVENLISNGAVPNASAPAAQAVTGASPEALLQAASGGISGARALELLS